MKKLLFLAAISMAMLSCNDTKDAEKTAGTTADTTNATKPPAEFADAKYADIGKRMQTAFESGNVAEWVNGYADNAVYVWSSGDSLVGKAAIQKYWEDRRGKVIDSIKFTNDIWLPIKINTPQKGPDAPGNWLLSWYQVDVKYNTGKRLSFWVHADHHFNDKDQVDRTIQYIDMAPIRDALK